ncbi:mCG145060, partial [Mus musculus]
IELFTTSQERNNNEGDESERNCTEILYISPRATAEVKKITEIGEYKGEDVCSEVLALPSGRSSISAQWFFSYYVVRQLSKYFLGGVILIHPSDTSPGLTPPTGGWARTV